MSSCAGFPFASLETIKETDLFSHPFTPESGSSSRIISKGSGLISLLCHRFPTDKSRLLSSCSCAPVQHSKSYHCFLTSKGQENTFRADCCGQGPQSAWCFHGISSYWLATSCSCHSKQEKVKNILGGIYWDISS